MIAGAIPAVHAAPAVHPAGGSSGVVLRLESWFLEPSERGLKALTPRAQRLVSVGPKGISGAREASHVRPVIAVVNLSSAAADGILIRYDFALEIAPKSDPQSASWAVPFMTDEYRIPRLAGRGSKNAPLDPEILRQALARVSAASFIATGLRFEAMLDPRPGDSRPLQKISGDVKIKP